MPKYCSGCGKELPDNPKFCPACGKQIETEVNETANKVFKKRPARTGAQKVALVIIIIFVVVAFLYIFYVCVGGKFIFCSFAGCNIHHMEGNFLVLVVITSLLLSLVFIGSLDPVLKR